MTRGCLLLKDFSLVRYIPDDMDESTFIWGPPPMVCMLYSLARSSAALASASAVLRVTTTMISTTTPATTIAPMAMTTIAPVESRSDPPAATATTAAGLIGHRGG